LFAPASRFRVSGYDYPAGTRFPAASREALSYVLRARLTYRFEKFGFDLHLSAGEFARLPCGTHQVLVGEEEAVSLVMAWELPVEFWTSHQDAVESKDS
jgi:hypothetical protein